MESSQPLLASLLNIHNRVTMSASEFTQRCLQTRVLIVDDVPSNRKMVHRLLKSRFGGIEEAENGQQAVEKVRSALEQSLGDNTGEGGASGVSSGPFHLVMMDFMMPVMNGPDATRSIKALDPSILVVGVTGNGQESDVEVFRAAGAEEVLLKPLSFHAFEKVLQRYWSSSSASTKYTCGGGI